VPDTLPADPMPACVGFDAPENEVMILGPGERRELVSKRGKREVADRIWDAFLLSRTPQHSRA